MKENIVLYALIALVIFFAAGSFVLHVTAPDDCNPRCGPVMEVRYPATFFVMSPGFAPGMHEETTVRYDGNGWEVQEVPDENNYSPEVLSRSFPPGTVPPVYTPDIEAEDGRLCFDVLLYNNVGYDLVNVSFDTSSEVQIKKNADGAYGEYSRYDPGSGDKKVIIKDFKKESFKEVRLSAPLFPAGPPESFLVTVSSAFPKYLETEDGDMLEYDLDEYVLPESIPDLYTVQGYGSSPVYEVFRFFIV